MVKPTISSSQTNLNYDVLIIGGGVVGTALLYILSRYTNIPKLALIEKYSHFGQVNSHRNNNSQTLHFGDIETNYNLEKAKDINKGANLLKNYLRHHHQHRNKQLYIKTSKIVLGIGEEQVNLLKKRHEEFHTLFPELKILTHEEITKLEPFVTAGRDQHKPLIALYSADGYGINYDLLAENFAAEAQKEKDVDIYLTEKVNNIKKRQGAGYTIITNKNTYRAKIVIFCSGSHSLIFAKKLKYGLEYGLLPVAGNFFSTTRKFLNGKVYTIQTEKLPFAAIHGDPYVDNIYETRFGPTAKVLPLLERHHYATIPDFVKTSIFRIKGILSLFTILFNPIIFPYVLKNLYYDLPILGKRSFLKEVRKIIPSIKSCELKFRKGFGGIRPQLVNWQTMNLELGDAKIIGENIIFNITPSPGASVCLKNAEQDAQTILNFFKENYKIDFKFNKTKFMNELVKS
ncbi:FAD-dependent oxidoreductase [Candidatus Woesearchaeota archaeon]|nr:FAD-dependent oxidoreductase [Candidatus Woesearchaeota archaeon]